MIVGTGLGLVAAVALAAVQPALAQQPQPAAGADEVRAAIQSQLPSPPDGFEWQLYKNAVFPKPKQWKERTREAVSGGIPMNLYAASPEDFSDTRQFETGMTLQIISGSQRIRGIEARKMAILYLKPFLDSHKKEDILLLDQKTRGDFELTFLRYRDAPPGLKPVIVHKFVLANNASDSVHAFTFESPVELWDENWAKYGTPILSRINVLANLPSN
jgi:hypothetical protein